MAQTNFFPGRPKKKYFPISLERIGIFRTFVHRITILMIEMTIKSFCKSLTLSQLLPPHFLRVA